jgi:outer membrane lipoprotein-sorting protein
MAVAQCAAACAQDAPMDLRASPAPKGAKVKAPPVQLTDADILARANAYLDGARVMNADFTQVSASGNRTQGQLAMERPGKMLFHYDPPAHLEIIADGRSVAVRDTKLGTEDMYFLWQTPLKFLLKDHIDLAKDTKVLSISADNQAVRIELEDKATLGGTSHLTLVFDPQTYALKQWTVIDPQRSQTVVTLANIDLKSPPDESQFVIPPPPIQSNKR